MLFNDLPTMLKILGIVLLLLAVAYCVESYVISDDDYTVTVNTTNGPVRGGFGARSHANRSQILYSFRSIPYAVPPVGDLRFAAPVPLTSWSGVLDVRYNPSECIQGSSPVAGSEDCLYLKIYSRHEPNKDLNLPVVVWIYGGAFFGGTADFDNHRPDFLLHEDVIVAAIQYRLGYLGFMSLGDTVAPGNNGIKDQILGLKWIKENIRNFGGDPDQITIWGQSAGAASVAYLLQAKQTKGLFNKAILNSGSSLCPWSLAKGLPDVTRQVALQLNIFPLTPLSTLEALRKVDVEKLQRAVSSVNQELTLLSNPLQGLVFAPVIEPDHDDAVITEYSYGLLSEGKFHHVPILAGYNSLEGYFNELQALFRLWLTKYDLYHAQLVPNDMNLLPITETTIAESIKYTYFDIFPVSLSTEKLMRYISDTQFDKPIHEALRLYSAYTKVYAYHFAYEGPLWGRTDREFHGVGHTEDLGYLFDYNITGSNEDYLARERMVRLWTNFIKYGDPTPKRESLLQNVIWPANSVVQKAENLKFLEINKDLKVVGLPNADKMLFWDDLYLRYGRPPYTTY
ncbi:pyrethroid hydrolase Ces2e-like [Diabrotica virgifera virgifera]|uniref:Carboxylic ester hydrolase n=1 Tax=Diabrotica virgifera virgifera TaxID=50390 RepID=A0ABM5KB38_DIAVI|nr:pyrethroid hydrolase Ces2e-like [Diabrotica virgifera virgifera]